MASKVLVKDIEKRLEEMDIKSALLYLYDIKESGEIKVDKLLEKYEKRKEKLEIEYARFKEMCKFEEFYSNKGYKMIAGIDEAGRGPLAGPVVAAAVIFPPNVFIEGLNDSKKLSAKQRDLLYDKIIDSAVTYAVEVVDEKSIDEINILNATKLAMDRSVGALGTIPDILLIDAQLLENNKIKQIPIIKGDSLSISIAAASILAKVTRDRLMIDMDKMYPRYGFEKHKGYGTKEHIQAIKEFGICPIHRVTFTKKFVSIAER